MERPVEKRRRVLKAMVAGGAAVTTATVLPDSWKKPIVDSIIVPLHAQGSAPAFIQSVEIAYEVTGDGGEGPTGTLTPTNSPESHNFDDSALFAYSFEFTPSIVVNSSITDTFDLTVNEVVAGGDSTFFSPTTQDLAPNNTTGLIPFTPITAFVDNATTLTYQFTLTPSNPAFTTYFLEITFQETGGV